MVELRLEDEESYRKYMRMDTVSFEVNIFPYCYDFNNSWARADTLFKIY